MKTKSKKQTSNILISQAKPSALPVDTQFHLAVSFHQQGRFKDAAKLYDSVVLSNPLHDEAWHMYGLVANQLGNHKQAIEAITKAINLDSKKAKYFNNRGLIHQQLLQFTEALDDFQESLQLDPNLAQAHCNKGNILQELHRYDEAKDSISTAIHIDPQYADAYFNRGNLWVILKNIEKAIEDFDRALSLFPRDADYTYNKSMALLLNGQYRLGWELYESRWHRASSKHHKREFSAPLWLGNESIKDKKILLYAEQGLGDTIQFIRYVPMVVKLGAQVFVEIQSPLMHLFQCIEGVTTWSKKGDSLPYFDFQCPLMSLPLAFKTQLDNIPYSKNYLSCDPAKTTVWRNKLGTKKRPRIGIAWSGSSIHKNDQNRSILLSSFKSIFCDGADFYSLQIEYRTHDIDFINENPKIIDFSNELEDFSDTACLCNSMDLIITVDTSVAHLSAALGKSTWVLVPHNPDFRWFNDRQDSPWYPSIQIFRQNSFDSWSQTLSQINQELTKFIATS